MEYKITILGNPRAKQRPRHTKKGITYTPELTVMYEKEIRDAFTKKYGQVMITGAIMAKITAYYAIAKSKSKKEKSLMLSGIIRPTKKPDVDNVAKSVLDSLNLTAYKDDSQVVDMSVKKYYSYEPRVELVLIPLITNGEEL